MSITVKLNRFGVAPRKVRLVCNLIRMKKASEALKILRFCEKKEISIAVTKLINSGLAIAASANKYDLDNLVVHKLMVDEGTTLKRIMTRAQGRAFRIRKRSSHITLELKEA
ncbi:MAG: 50S ribosomal protein L22 [Pseudomonadota bacterium]